LTPFFGTRKHRFVKPGTTLLLLLVTASCGAKSTQAIRPRAAAELQCAESEIKVARARQTRIQAIEADLDRIPAHRLVSGCGRTMLFLEDCPDGYGSGSKSCNWLPVERIRNESLLRRASFDLGCDPRALRLTPLDPRTTGVTGCGHQVTYVLNCPHNPELWSHQCAWLLNTDSVAQAPAPVAPAPVAPVAPPVQAAPPVPVAPPPVPTAAPAQPAAPGAP
jgi:hypothetical protein